MSIYYHLKRDHESRDFRKLTVNRWPLIQFYRETYLIRLRLFSTGYARDNKERFMIK